MKPQIKMIKTTALIPYVMNSRTHSEQQVAQIAASIKEFGFTNPILTDGENGIIAGHGRLLAAQKLELAEVPVIELSHLSDAQKRAYIIADNKLALNAGWDDEILKSELQALQDEGFDLDIVGFDINELDEILNDKKDNETENPYTGKIESPVYEPNGEKPKIEDLYNDEYAMGLIEDIKNSDIPENEKQFLMMAASRHIVFDYEKIANYYAHSNPCVQALMENSALVIIDFNKAIELGFVNFSKRIDSFIESQMDEDDEQ